jgi:uncharacterized protein YxeA
VKAQKMKKVFKAVLAVMVLAVGAGALVWALNVARRNRREVTRGHTPRPATA